MNILKNLQQILAIIEQLNKIKQSGGRKNKKTKHNKKRRRKRKN